MKPQDIVFLIIFLVLLIKRDPMWLVVAGMVCLVVSIPLFYKWIFFTAQHLTWYAGLCFLAAAILLVWRLRKVK